jgi:carboxyl-terminal processing protease
MKMKMNRLFKLLTLLALVVLGLSATLVPTSNKYFEIIKNIEIFTNLYKEVNTYYVDDLDPGKLMKTGIDAMVGSLDPYTNYMSESEIQGYRLYTEGNYNGLGAVSEKMGAYVVITELYEDQPADKAGLKVGDKIMAINGMDAKNRNVEEVNNMLAGVASTDVSLTIERPGTPESLVIKLTRGEINVPNVPYYGMVGDHVGYINLTIFTNDAGKNVARALKDLKTKDPELKGVVLDLRDNGGGLLHEAVNVCNVFIPQGQLVTSTRGKVVEWDRSYHTQNPSVDEDIPLVVLINKRSASASEIVSGVMQDYDRGVLLGQRSYGKGLVQNTMDIGYNSRVKITTAKYYIPSGRCIQSVEYANGEPVSIPDEQRAVFKTKAGRPVLDGGGVKPDVAIDPFAEEPVVKALIKQQLVFDYVTNFALKHPEIAAIEDFRFEDFEDFMKFVADKNFDYETEATAALRKLREKVASEQADVLADIDRLSEKLEQSKQKSLVAYKDLITDLIEKEIAGRYYFQRGKTQMGLRNDIEIKEAVKLLNDSAAYAALLKSN